MKKYICIHGHFYQPPRENAWLEHVELQDSAHPFHDWNERITAECYAPNAASRILDERGVIQNIINNYSRISFNFGPTLLSWLHHNEPDTYQAILDADAESLEYFQGHGSAIAQSYGHIILPLANSRDKETQIVWGIKDFQHRFGRMPEGMWLAETAVDNESLDLMASHGIKFTILAPRQVKRVRKSGSQEWEEANENTVNTRQPYWCHLPSGRKIAIFYYDGEASQAVAFNNILANGSAFAERLLSRFVDDESGPQLVHIATDGESYGHHHKHGDMALAYALNHIETVPDASLVNYGMYLEEHPPEYETEIFENSSWSCVHGVERWRANCGCNTGGRPEWDQNWRKPLRESLDWLRGHLIRIYEKVGKEFLKDPWNARQDYIQVVLNRDEDNVQAFIEKHALPGVSITRVHRLLEMQRHAMLMYTSCGWFFDEVSGIETTQIMQYACRAIQLADQVSGEDLEIEFIERIKKANSNIPELGNAAVAYKKYVIPSRIGLTQVGMHYAVATIFEKNPESFPVFNFITKSEFFVRKEAGVQRLAIGITRIKSKVTYSERLFSFAVLYLGQHNIIGNISKDMPREEFDKMTEQAVASFEKSNLGDLISTMQTYFGPEKYTMWHLFKDEKRKVLNEIMQKNLAQVENAFRMIYNRDYQLINALSNDGIPIPTAYETTLKYVLNADLSRAFQSEFFDLKELDRIASSFKKWNLKIDDSLALQKQAGQSITNALLKLQEEITDVDLISRLNRFFDIIREFDLSPDLYIAQNLYHEISKEAGDTRQKCMNNRDWHQAFGRLGENLGIRLNGNPK